MTAPAVVWRPDRRAAARQQRRPGSWRPRASTTFADARARGRSTSPSGSGTRSCASSACRSPTPYDRGARHVATGIPWATWFTGGRCNLAVDVRRPLGRRSATRDEPAVVWEGEEGDVRDAHVAPSCAALTDRIASGLARARRAARRRGRAVPADGARDGRRAVRGREARRDLPADLLRLRRRRGRDPARGRAARSRSSPPTASRGAARSCR